MCGDEWVRNRFKYEPMAILHKKFNELSISKYHVYNLMIFYYDLIMYDVDGV